MTEPPASPSPAPQPLNPGLPASPTPLEAGWSRQKFLLVFTLLLAFHVALISLLETRKPIRLRPVTDVPHLRLASHQAASSRIQAWWLKADQRHPGMTRNADEFVALSDPTLFARPNPHDVVSAFWRRMAPAPLPDFNWSEAARYLNPGDEAFGSGRPAADFGSEFHAFAQASAGEFALNFKPVPQEIAPPLADDEFLPRTTTLRITGELASRPLLNPDLALPVLPRNEVLEPSRVQALVDCEGNVVSALLPAPTTDSAADQRALQLVRAFRFAPAPQLMLGDITLVWHTVPLVNTNPP